MLMRVPGTTVQLLFQKKPLEARGWKAAGEQVEDHRPSSVKAEAFAPNSSERVKQELGNLCENGNSHLSILGRLGWGKLQEMYLL